MGKTPLYATIEADEQTSIASKSSRRVIRTHTRGWDVGVKVYGTLRDGVPTFDIYTTGGSNNTGEIEFLGAVTLDAGKPRYYVPEECG